MLRTRRLRVWFPASSPPTSFYRNANRCMFRCYAYAGKGRVHDSLWPLLPPGCCCRWLPSHTMWATEYRHHTVVVGAQDQAAARARVRLRYDLTTIVILRTSHLFCFFLFVGWGNLKDAGRVLRDPQHVSWRTPSVSSQGRTLEFFSIYADVPQFQRAVITRHGMCIRR